MDFKESFLGNVYSIGEISAFIVFTIIGMFLIKLVRYNVKKKKCLRDVECDEFKFSWSIWLNDNLLDFIIAFISSFLTLRFLGSIMKSMPLPIPDDLDTMFYGLLLGLFYQYIWHKILNKVEVPILDK